MLFFFDLIDGADFHRDDTGLDLPDIDAAYRAAEMTLPRISVETVGRGRSALHMEMIVRDADNATVLTATLDWSIKPSSEAYKPT